MRLGFEDWDFWLQAIGLGYVGRHVESMGLRYRKRPESMLSNSERDRSEILGYMRRKHRSEEHTSELQSLMRISYAVFCLKKKKKKEQKKQYNTDNKQTC